MLRDEPLIQMDGYEDYGRFCKVWQWRKEGVNGCGVTGCSDIACSRSHLPAGRNSPQMAGIDGWNGWCIFVSRMHITRPQSRHT